MKTAIKIFIISIYIINHGFYAQTFKIYNQSFKSSRILGKGDFLQTYGLRTVMIEPANKPSSIYDFLGKSYSKKNFYDVNVFLDETFAGSAPILDSINCYFYLNYGFGKIKKRYPKLLQDAGYLKFKKSLTEAPTIKEKKDVLNNDENYQYLQILDAFKYRNIFDSIPFKLFDSIKTEIKLGIAAELTAQINKSVSINAQSKNEFEANITKNITLQNAYYREIKLDDDYITSVNIIIAHYEKDPKVLDKYSDPFSKKLRIFLESGDLAVISAVAIFEIELTSDSYNKIIAEVGAKVDATADVNSDKGKIKAGITAGLRAGKKHGDSVSLPKTYFCIKYGRNALLELGKQ